MSQGSSDTMMKITLDRIEAYVIDSLISEGLFLSVPRSKSPSDRHVTEAMFSRDLFCSAFHPSEPERLQEENDVLRGGEGAEETTRAARVWRDVAPPL